MLCASWTPWRRTWTTSCSTFTHPTWRRRSKSSMSRRKAWSESSRSSEWLLCAGVVTHFVYHQRLRWLSVQSPLKEWEENPSDRIEDQKVMSQTEHFWRRRWSWQEFPVSPNGPGSSCSTFRISWGSTNLLGLFQPLGPSVACLQMYTFTQWWSF